MNGLNQSIYIPFHFFVLRGHKVRAKGSDVFEPVVIGQDVGVAHGKVP